MVRDPAVVELQIAVTGRDTITKFIYPHSLLDLSFACL
jgi:hypothetical protein